MSDIKPTVEKLEVQDHEAPDHETAIEATSSSVEETSPGADGDISSDAGQNNDGNAPEAAVEESDETPVKRRKPESTGRKVQRRGIRVCTATGIKKIAPTRFATEGEHMKWVQCPADQKESDTSVKELVEGDSQAKEINAAEGDLQAKENNAAETQDCEGATRRRKPSKKLSSVWRNPTSHEWQIMKVIDVRNSNLYKRCVADLKAEQQRRGEATRKQSVSEEPDKQGEEQNTTNNPPQA